MDEVTKTIHELWPVFLGALIAFAWLIRLEAKVLYLEKDQTKSEEILKVKDATMWAKFGTIETNMNLILQSLGRLEGKLSNRNEKEV